MKIKKLNFAILLFSCVFLSCKKTFLDAKPSTNISTPQSLQDYRSLLENTIELYRTPALGHLAADEYQYIDDDSWQNAQTAIERNSYIWAKDIFEGKVEISDWNLPYKNVFYANNVLDGIDKVDKNSLEEYNKIKGWAYFLRGWSYFSLVSTFSKNYDENTAGTDLGIPLRNSAGVDEINPRSTMKQTYDQLLSDLKSSARLLPSQFQQANRNCPSRSTAYAALARVYLCMNKYSEAELYADSSLALYNKLQDYNKISASEFFPFTDTNVESLFFSIFVQGYAVAATLPFITYQKIDPTLVALYDVNDLRLSVLLGVNALGNHYRKPGYGGAVIWPFSGVATDEMYLIKAECLARRNQISSAMNYLDQLLVKRYDSAVPYVPSLATSQQQAIDIVLAERRKELVFRGIRWLDIRRLNKLGANITLRRTVQGKVFTLSPNDDRYAFPIPDDEIHLSGIVQNPR